MLSRLRALRSQLGGRPEHQCGLSLMATASPPPTPDSNTSKHRTIITITALVAILAIVILLALYGKKNSPHRRLEELQLQNELQRSGHRRRRRKRPPEKGIAPSLLQYIPAVRYGSSLGERRTRSLDLEKGQMGEYTQAWSLAQSQLKIKAMQVEMNDIGQSLHVNKRATNSKKLQGHFEQQECTICTQPFFRDEWIRILPCGHLHHKTCVDQWLVGFSGTCPVW